MTAYSSILAWEIPWTEKPGGLQSMGSQRVRHNSVTKHTSPHTHTLLTADCCLSVSTKAIHFPIT